MIVVMGQMALLILVGVAWRIIRPGSLDADSIRTALTTLVFNLLLPALVLSVLWQARIGYESLLVSLFGVAIILCGFILSAILVVCWDIDRKTQGAAILAIAFPNVTYLGLPLLEQTFGPWSRSIVIQIDLFAATPLVLTMGVWIARRYGDAGGKWQGVTLRSLASNPPLWAAAIALSLNLKAVTPPIWLKSALDQLAEAVVPLMLISLGLSLRLDAWRRHNLALSIVVLVLRLVVVPLLGLGLGLNLGFTGDKLNALVLESAMPAMLLGIVFCDRYRLDTSFYAMSVALTTLCAMITLPIWYQQIHAMRLHP